MIKRDPVYLSFYERRKRLLLDEAARLKYAEFEGREKGYNEGKVEGIEQGIDVGRPAGMIQAYQRLLGLAETPAETFRALPEEKRVALALDLERQVREQMGR